MKRVKRREQQEGRAVSRENIVLPGPSVGLIDGHHRAFVFCRGSPQLGCRVGGALALARAAEADKTSGCL